MTWRKLPFLEKIERIKAAWTLNCSASMLAEKCGAPSRNSIIGVYHRFPEHMNGYPLRLKYGARPDLSPEERRSRRLSYHREYNRRRKGNVVTLKPKHTTSPAKPSPAKERPRLRVVSNNVDLMVKDFLATYGARKFERGATTDYVVIVNFLRDRGYELRGSRGWY